MTAIAIAALVGGVLGTAGAVVFFGLDASERNTVPEAPQHTQAESRTPRLEDGDVSDHALVATIADAVLPAVVMVEVSGGQFGGALGGNGSGVVYSAEGHIITNHHVIADTDRVQVVFSDGGRYPADVIGSTADHDIAVLQIDEDEGPDLVPIQIGDSTAVRVGELAVAVGSPFGLEGSVTSGVVSSLNRRIPVTGPDGETFPLSGVLQTDAAINPGNSGGPLVAADGSLIGINSAILTHGQGGTNAGVGFAIPVNVAVDIADQLITDGVVRQAFLGVAGITINNEIAEEVRVPEGVLVDSVVDGAPADESGIVSGDVITALDGESMTTMEDLVAAIFARDVGDSVEITYIRDGAEDRVEVELIDKADAED